MTKSACNSPGRAKSTPRLEGCQLYFGIGFFQCSMTQFPAFEGGEMMRWRQHLPGDLAPCCVDFTERDRKDQPMEQCWWMRAVVAGRESQSCQISSPDSQSDVRVLARSRLDTTAATLQSSMVAHSSTE